MSKELDKFQRPSRYVGGEVNAVIKSENDVDLHVALAFPDVYEIGMSHLGLKILYGLINQRPEIWAERVMAPWLDLEDDLRRNGQTLVSLESGRRLADFDLIGFSLQYELSFTNVLNMLDLAGLPLLAAERGEDAPLVIGGGPCACNPEPVADFFDFFFIGDAEAGFLEVLDQIRAWKRNGGSKKDLLLSLAGRPGVYVPSFFQPVYGQDGRLAEIRPLVPGYDRVKRAVISDLDAAYFPERQVVPFTKPIHDRIALEISRGCTRGCRFCQAGFIYRPVRERSPQTILNLARETLAAMGHDEVSFLSLSAGDYICLQPLMSAFMDAHSPRRVALSLPSLRVKALNPAMMKEIKRVRKTGFTLAPEAGTQRLRDVINKDLTEDDLMYVAREAFALGWRLIKLYFMVGLPSETDEDVIAIADLARRVQAGSRSKVNVSFATFVPKANTPFQWEAMLNLEQMHQRMRLLRDNLQRPGLKPKWNDAEASLLEGVLSRGDRRLGRVLQILRSKGARFDAWSEALNLNHWLEAMAEAGLTTDEYLRARSREEVLPWSHLGVGVEQDYFWAEREKALQAQKTADCREHACTKCGVCDFKEIKPRLYDPEKDAPVPAAGNPPEGDRVRFWVNYTKEGPARFLSHLETIDVFTRAVRRAGLDFYMSQGFHPQPRIAFASPLSVGIESRDEYAEIQLVGPPEAAEVERLLRAQMPGGFYVKAVLLRPEGSPKLSSAGARYLVRADGPLFEPDLAERFALEDEVMVEKKSKKGLRRLDLKPLVGEIRVLTPDEIEIILLSGEVGSVRPLKAVEVISGLSPEKIETASVVKLETLLDNIQASCPQN